MGSMLPSQPPHPQHTTEKCGSYRHITHHIESCCVPHTILGTDQLWLAELGKEFQELSCEELVDNTGSPTDTVRAKSSTHAHGFIEFACTVQYIIGVCKPYQPKTDIFQQSQQISLVHLYYWEEGSDC